MLPPAPRSSVFDLRFTSARAALALALTWLLVGAAAGCKRQEPAKAHEHPDNPTLSASVAANTSTLLTVEANGQRATVDLASLPQTTFAGQPAVTMTALWEAAKLGPMTNLVFDFEGDDGFKPSAKPKCAQPLPATELAKALIVVKTRSLEWPDAGAVPRCWSVKLTKRIIATKA